MLKPLTLAFAAAGLLSSVAAQTYTDCNPLTNTSCSADTGLTKSSYSVDFTAGEDSDNWSSVGTGDITYASTGAKFTISEKGDAPTLETDWYIFFGRVEVHMKAASGTGIVSCAILLSDDLDEIDWEWLGGENGEVQTDYFGKGNSTGDRGGISDVTDTQGTSHNYTITWTSSETIWYIDGTVTRTLTYADALDGSNYPQTPMRIKLGIWAGGDSDNSEGTIEWAGGETDYDDGPFTMTVESVKIENYNPAKSYTYGDQTGDYTSIEYDAVDGDSSSSSAAATSTTSTKKASTKTTSTKTAATGTSAASAAATTVANKAASNASSASNSSATSSSASTATTTPATVTTSAEARGEHISPNVWVLLGACVVFFLF